MTYTDEALDTIPDMIDEDLPRCSSKVENNDKTIKHEKLREKIR